MQECMYILCIASRDGGLIHTTELKMERSFFLRSQTLFEEYTCDFAEAL